MVSPIRNQWQGRSDSFALDPLPLHLLQREGVAPLRVTVDPTVGPEIVLLWIDPTPFAHQLAEVKPFRLHVTAGVADMDAGALIFILYWIAPLSGNDGAVRHTGGAAQSF